MHYSDDDDDDDDDDDAADDDDSIIHVVSFIPTTVHSPNLRRIYCRRIFLFLFVCYFSNDFTEITKFIRSATTSSHHHYYHRHYTTVNTLYNAVTLIPTAVNHHYTTAVNH